ncbi:MAG TPA: hypothetical protein VFS00_23845 [Polyangiaceae bacterium]|nr:hypothetical protein [Polyangiaceae bacterium]
MATDDPDAPPTPSGVRKPQPTLDLLEQARSKAELSSSDVLRLSHDDYKLVTHQRLKNAEAAQLETAEAVKSVDAKVETLAGDLTGKFEAQSKSLADQFTSQLASFRTELFGHITPLKLRYAGLAGIAAVAAAVGGALLTHFVNAVVQALRR